MPLGNDLAEFWSRLEHSSEQGWIHPCDWDAIKALGGDRVRFDAPPTDEDAIEEVHRERSRLQAHLIPQPFIGNLADPKVVICLTNPGFGWGDYAVERHDDEFQKLKLANFVRP
jgi:hypothetical protein